MNKPSETISISTYDYNEDRANLIIDELRARLVVANMRRTEIDYHGQSLNGAIQAVKKIAYDSFKGERTGDNVTWTTDGPILMELVTPDGPRTHFLLSDFPVEEAQLHAESQDYDMTEQDGHLLEWVQQHYSVFINGEANTYTFSVCDLVAMLKDAFNAKSS